MKRLESGTTVVELNEELAAALPDDAEAVFDRVLALEGDVYRELDGRRTLRVKLAGKSFFLKTHTGTTWREVLKNLAGLRLPVLGAEVERRAIERFAELGIETTSLAGFGSRGRGPTRRQSFLITAEIENSQSLEIFCRDWPHRPPPFALRRALVEKVAELVRRMHLGGVHHRDCYACHFLLDLDSASRVRDGATPRLFVIDLHRARLGGLAGRARLKDLAGVFFSSLDFGLTRADLLRFVASYSGRPLREVLATARGSDRRFWSRVERRARRLYRKIHGREAPPSPWRSRARRAAQSFSRSASASTR